MAKVLISIQEDFLDKVDSLAKNEQRTRSEFIRQALRVYLRRKKRETHSGNKGRNAELIESMLFN